MTPNEIKSFKDKVDRYIESRRLHDAIKEIKELARRTMAWEVTDMLARVEEGYAYMLKYMAEGVEDPARAQVYASIIADLYAALDTLLFYLKKIDNPSQYFSTIRYYEKTPNGFDIGALMDKYAQQSDKTSIFSMLGSGANEDDLKLAEQTQSQLFAVLWTKPMLRTADVEAIENALSDNSFPEEAKTHLLSAVILGLTERYDSKRLQILMDAYMNSENIEISSVALVGLLLGLWKYRERPISKSLSDRLAALKEKESWPSDLKIAFLEMIRARDTERINKKIQEEVLPGMMNLRPEIMSKLKETDENTIDLSSLQENPEWQELLDKNGITDKLKELTEMQMEGGDVMMSTFSHLKNFNFFQDISNWFLPFTASQSQVRGLMGKLGVMSDMIENAIFLCDSDKYSFVFALEMVPQGQRDLMTSQLQAQSDSIYESLSERANDVFPQKRKHAVNRYMQNIYRFFKLYRRKNEFFDPFASSINLISVPSLAEDFDDELMEIVAEFYFKLGYMQDALEIFKRLDMSGQGSAQRYQKMGYCYEKMGNFSEAIKYYQKAELLDQQSVWTLRRLASCYRAIGDTANALACYTELEKLKPDDLNIALLLGYVLLESGKYDDALKQFYKVEFLDEKSDRSWRPLAWTLFMNGDFEASKRYYERIIEDAPTSNDYLNMGHVALAMRDMRNAVNSYMLSIQMNGGDREAFIKAMKTDEKSLLEAGISIEDIPLITDAVFYTMEQ